MFTLFGSILAIWMVLSIPVWVLRHNLIKQVPTFDLMISGSGWNPRFLEVQVEDSPKVIGVQFSLHNYIFNCGAVIAIFVISGDG